MAVVIAYFDLAAMLVDRGANPNAPDPRGSALHTLAWLRKPGSDGAAGVGNTGHAPPPPTGRTTALELAKKLLDHGANPNVRIDWKEIKFGKEGGTTRNPPNIQLGRHLLSYVGATPFYVAAKNGDAPYMKLLADRGADPKMTTKAGITPLMVAAGLDYWEGEAPGPFTGVSEAERLEAVKLAVALGNDVNARADFGAYPMAGDTAYTLLYYPHNIDDLLELGVGDPRWSGSTPMIGAVVVRAAVHCPVAARSRRAAERQDETRLDTAPCGGVFFANAKKEFPQAAAILRKSRRRWPSVQTADAAARDSALKRGAWTSARRFQASLREQETAEALEASARRLVARRCRRGVRSRGSARTSSIRSAESGPLRREWPCGWPGTAGRSAARTPWPTAGSSARVVCSKASRRVPSARGSKCVKARSACS
jgi:hypothetical protein